MSAGAQRTPEQIRQDIEVALRQAGFKEAGIRIWWSRPHRELGGLTPAQLWDMGMYQTVIFACVRLTSSQRLDNLADRVLSEGDQ